MHSIVTLQKFHSCRHSKTQSSGGFQKASSVSLRTLSIGNHRVGGNLQRLASIAIFILSTNVLMWLATEVVDSQLDAGTSIAIDFLDAGVTTTKKLYK